MALKAAPDLLNEKGVKVLEIIDKLRDLGVSESVSLPQLVVVGDQSSGKSSLLEGLTGLSFPVASDLCTRFATQIVLRRAPSDEAGAKITIIPGPSAKLDDTAEKRLRKFKKELATDDFGSDEFGRIFDEAAECMGLPGPSTPDIEHIDKRFSDDILKIELSGPGQHHLSVVDVPGLFHNPTKYQTEEDRTVIRDLIQRWITDKRTIILAVMDAGNNFANQGVFSMARAADPAGKRTVGIITKCDAVQTGDEAGVIRIAVNQVEKLTHGWFTVKNRSTREIDQGMTIEGCHKKEKEFFSATAPWTALPRDRVGIHSLKKFLGGLLYDHIRNAFPNVVKDIETLLANTERELNFLGASRQTTIDQRRFLNSIANMYQHEVNDALGGNYNAELDPDSPIKLRMHVRSSSDKFANSMKKRGHAKIFLTVKGGLDPEFFHRALANGEDILAWIRQVYRESRGTELPGTVNPMVLHHLFRQLSSPWEGIARGYVKEVANMAKAYNAKILVNIIPDEDVRGVIDSRLSQVLETTLARAMEEFCRLLHDERGGSLQTVNHYYADTLNAIRKDRVRARLEATGLRDGPWSAHNLLSNVMNAVHLSNEDQAVNDIHDILKAYYKVAVKRFTDNVIMQVVERHILGPEGPVRALCSDMVNGLDNQELLEIAGESFVTSSMRNELISKCERFRSALDIARRAGI
ncbi:P-loop containing nucleoside triphosphate hydrolase protein [Aspergillus californicus]